MFAAQVEPGATLGGVKKGSVPSIRVAVLGVGLVGGSFGLALRARGLARSVAAYSRTAATRELAVARGAADVACASPEECVAGADLVYLATPVDAIVPLVARLLPHLAPGALLTDAGSSKERIVAEIAALDLGDRAFVGGHPMTGSHRMGVEHARADLFEGTTYVLTPTPDTPPAVLARLSELVTALGARPLVMSPAGHDQAVAMVSHVPHLLAYALTAATARRAQAGEPVCELAAGSWHGATRVAASGAQLWREILLSNRGAALAALADFRGELDRLSDALERGDAAALEALLAAARLCKEACGPPPAGRRGCEDPV